MATLKDLGITEKRVRAYAFGDTSKLTEDQLRALAHEHLTKVMRVQDKYKTWSKKILKDMRLIGVHQSTTTGDPYIAYRKKKVCVEQMTADVTEMGKLALELDKAETEIVKLKAEIEALNNGSYEDEKPKKKKIKINNPKVETKQIKDELA